MHFSQNSHPTINIMKQAILLFALCIGSLFAQDTDMYSQAMGQSLQGMKDAKTPQDQQAVINQFARIADAEPERWVPGYYTVMSQATLVFQMEDEDAMDALLDEAQARLDKLLAKFPAESELWALQGMIYQGRIQVSPMIRGMKYSGKASEAFEKAKTLNPQNPRALLLQAQNILYTPSFFGGGLEKACPIFQEAVAAYEIDEARIPFAPTWGAGRAASFAAKCQAD